MMSDPVDLSVWERMAAHAASSALPEMTADEVRRAQSSAPPQTVDELVKRLNTRGGACYMDHATMIREFMRARGLKED